MTSTSNGDDDHVHAGSAGARAFTPAIGAIAARDSRCWPQPQATASLLSSLTFEWLSPLLRTGAKRPLQADDLFGCYDTELSETCWKDFESAWAAEQADAHRTARTASLSRVTLRLYLVPILVSAVFFGVTTADSLLAPWFLNRLISYITRVAMADGVDTPDKMEGYQWAIYLFASALCTTFARSYSLHLILRAFMRVRSILVQAIFRKTLKLDPRYRNEGQINNMMSSDTQKIIDFALQSHNIWAVPIIIAIGVWELYDQVGWSAFVCLGVLFLSLPIAGLLTSLVFKYQQSASKETDKRTTIINEMLQGIRVIKYYAWERPFIERISEQRDVELVALRNEALARSMMLGTMFVTPLLATVLVFVTFSITNGSMTSATVFSALALISTIRSSFMFLPIALGGLTQSLVAFARIETFLQLPDVDSKQRERWNQVGVQLVDAEFTWPTAIPSAGDEKKEGVAGVATAGSAAAGGAATARGAAAGGAVRADTGARAASGVPAVSADSADAALRARLTQFNLTVTKGQLCMVLGPVGCGKSTLIQGILGEVPRTAGHVRVGGNISYVPQTAFIVNASLRDNVVFGKPFDEERYRRVIHACCLQPDIDLLPNGDRTEIGERGINVSGGQKQRICLARALYDSESDFVLLDDALSAVDMHVAKHIFNHCINGMMRDRARVFITNSLQFVEAADVVVLLKPCGHEDTYSIGSKGTYAELVASDPDFVELLHTYRHSNEAAAEGAAAAAGDEGAAVNAEAQAAADAVAEANDDAMSDPTSQLHNATAAELHAATNGAGTIEALVIARASSFSSLRVLKTTDRSQHVPHRSVSHGAGGVVRGPSGVVVGFVRGENGAGGAGGGAGGTAAGGGTASAAPAPVPTTATAEERGALVEQEEREEGHITSDVYLSYMRAGGSPLLYVLLPLFFLANQALLSAADIWLSDWSNQAGTSSEHSLAYYVKTYCLLMGGASVALYARSVCTLMFGVRASRNMHREMLESVLRKSMSWFDRTPTGRIINRFTKDMFTVDVLLVMFGEFTISTSIALLGTVAVIVYVLPIALVVFIIVGIIFVLLTNFYRRSNRELQRLEALSRTPIFAHFAETLNGTVTIRALRVESMFILENQFRLDASNRSFYFSRAAQFWLRVRLDVLGTVILVVVSCLGVASSDINSGISPGKFGLMITYSLSLTQLLNYSVMMLSQLEGFLNSAERVQYYSQSHGAEEQWEALDAHEEQSASKQWPSKGRVVIRDVDMRYRADLDLVLRNVNLELPGGARVGVVGRTGSGKSSLLVTLFRSVEPCAGHIEIDGIRTDKIALSTLRSGISIIPQDAIMFSGSLRYNLDPFHRHTDEEVWSALSCVQLEGVVSRMPSKLDTMVAEMGSNLSSGQRQLLCMARALLRRSKVICLDEATANVDVETDEIIQKVIRTRFQGSTLITIAHRLNTILDYDYVVVMDRGRVVEFDSPAVLRARPGGVFAGMVDAAAKQVVPDDAAETAAQKPSV